MRKAVDTPSRNPSRVNGPIAACACMCRALRKSSAKAGTMTTSATSKDDEGDRRGSHRAVFAGIDAGDRYHRQEEGQLRGTAVSVVATSRNWTRH